MASLSDLERYVEDRFSTSKSLISLCDGHPSSTRANLNSLLWQVGEFEKEVKKFKAETLNEWRERMDRIIWYYGRIQAARIQYATISEAILKCKSLPQYRLQKGLPKAAKSCSEKPVEEVKKKKKVGVPPSALLSYLTVEEFKDVPAYMKGRMSLRTLNSCLDDFNSLLTDKYTFLQQGFANMKSLDDKKKYKAYKSLDTADSKGTYFLVWDDFKASSNLKFESTRRNVFNILRHSKRTREIRGPGSIVRYAAK